MPLHIVVTRRRVAFLQATVVYLTLAMEGTAQETHRVPRVRSANPVIATAIAQGVERSMTFRHVIEAIEVTDGLVYIQDGQCGRSVRACLHLSVAINGPYRYLRILVDLRKAPDCELVASIGHELQHALEALSNPKVRSSAEIFHFFHRIGPTDSGTFETRAAQKAGLMVEKEACAQWRGAGSR